MNPKVSVIVPIYGVEKYLRQCVDSIISQTLKNIEIILIDDGSPDGCPAIVDEYAAKDSRVVAVHQENGGYGRAVNHGIELAKGEYIGIVEPDDWIEPEMYEVLYSKAVCDSLDVIKSNFIPHNIANRFLRPLPNKWAEAPSEDKVLTVDALKPKAPYFTSFEDNLFLMKKFEELGYIGDGVIDDGEEYIREVLLSLIKYAWWNLRGLDGKTILFRFRHCVWLIGLDLLDRLFTIIACSLHPQVKL